ncbi:MAG: hypothetical protein Q7U47_11780 [Paludibacter sp.]|nr:hypothetical protein [Paludibacter sp.]
MKKSILFSLSLFFVFTAVQSQIKLPKITAPGVKWESTYHFDKCNVFKVDFYAKNNELMRTLNYRTYYQSEGGDFSVKLMSDKKSQGLETVFDIKNEVAIQIWGSGEVTKPYYNAGGFKYPVGNEIKKLEISPTNETKQMLGVNCKKYTYTYKKIFGEVWITDQINLSNDFGIFRAAKMASLHNTLSVGGFVMEMTTEDAKGGKTVMKTISLKNDEKYTLNFGGVEMNTAINKINYFTF